MTTMPTSGPAVAAMSTLIAWPWKRWGCGVSSSVGLHVWPSGRYQASYLDPGGTRITAKAVEDGSDIAARTGMANAATLAGLACCQLRLQAASKCLAQGKPVLR